MAEEVKPKEPEVLFVDINPENPVTKIQSLCMECGEEGTTSFLLTSIPHFREIIISSFECPNCGAKNNTVQFGGSIQPKGIRITCKIVKPDVRLSLSRFPSWPCAGVCLCLFVTNPDRSASCLFPPFSLFLPPNSPVCC